MLADMELRANIDIRVEGEVGADNTLCRHWLTLIYVGRTGEVGTEGAGGWAWGGGKKMRDALRRLLLQKFCPR